MNNRRLTMGLLAISFLLSAGNVHAKEGEMGYFGGTSAGVKLPTTIEYLQNKKTASLKYTLPYKENVYLTGKALAVEGTISIKPGSVDKTKGSGKYSETYAIKAQTKDGSVKVTRTVTLNTEYVYNDITKQTTKTTTVGKWAETVVANGNTYTLDSSKSSFTKSIFEDYTPGAMYYRGDTQYDAVYKNVTTNEEVVMSVSGPIYGYEQAYAKSETQKRTVKIDTGKQQYYIQEMPSVTVHKDLQYDSNEPTAMSIAGNYKEFIRGEGFINYSILQGSQNLSSDEKTGSTSIEQTPVIEQLALPNNIANIKGHPAEADVKRMFSMQIFDDVPSKFSPNSQIKKSEYIKMLVKALHIPLKDSKALAKVENPFTDVTTTNSTYPYLYAAYEAGLIGKGQTGHSQLVTREQALVLNIRAIGLERLGMVTFGGTTTFSDDKQISSWAKSSVHASAKLGLLPQTSGYLYPSNKVTKAEAATLFNSLIEYLRYELQDDYNQKMTL